jgi:hypothetical protein
MHDYLVFCSTRHGQTNAELGIYGADRNFDLCIHDYSSWGTDPQEKFKRSEYWFTRPKAEKLETAAMVLPHLPVSYKYYAFLDDDLTITTDQLNRLFLVGDSLGLDLYQPALTGNSYGSWKHLFQYELPNCPAVRDVDFVEIMMPFMSKAFLDKHIGMFDCNISGWGLDLYDWGKGYLVNSIAVGHYRKPERRNRILRNGLTPAQELWIMTKIYNPDDCSLPPC